MKRTTLMQKLTDLGFLVSTAESFYGEPEKKTGGIWIMGQGENEVAQGMWHRQWSEDLNCEDLSGNSVDDYLRRESAGGWHVEWYDSGTMMLWS